MLTPLVAGPLLPKRILSIAHAFHIREGKRHDLWLIIHRFPASSLLAAAAIRVFYGRWSTKRWRRNRGLPFASVFPDVLNLSGASAV